mmetsp:Transcript_15189/g.21808  ORF Transcript_15189/g.21808 Transcript_15189/m.21808 type:complete len:253 (-) Transcript_15189:233-991(-)
MAKITINNNKRKASTPPDGYICRACGEPGHWIQQCTEAKKKKRKKSSNHSPVAGIDPSQDDIEKARELQKIRPPNCFCGIRSRLRKVKKSHTGGDESRAIGHYFFFCSKKKDDSGKCRFARPVEDEMKPKSERICTFFASKGSCKKGDKCMFSHDIDALKKKNDNDSGRTMEVEKTEGEKDAEEEINKDKKGDDSGTSSSSSDDDSDDYDGPSRKVEEEINKGEKGDNASTASSSSDDDSDDSSSSDSDGSS